MAATADRNTPVQGSGGVPNKNYYPVAASTTIYKGTMVCLDASGNLVEASDSASLSAVVGMSTEHIDNSSGAAGDLSCNVQQCVARWINGNAMTKANVAADCYVTDNQTVASSGTSHSVIAGTVYLVDANGVWVYSGLQAPSDASALTTFEANLAATTHGEGASLVGVEDAGTLLTAADVEDALTEIVKKANAALGNPVTVPVILAAHSNSSIAARFTPGVAGKILGIHASVVNPVTTGSKLGTFTPAIAGTPTTGGALALTSANCATVGAKVDGTAITAANSFTSAQEITIAASSVTAFVEGEVVIYLFLASA